MANRIYSVEFHNKTHLVDAISRAAAINHVLSAHHKIDVAVPKVNEVIRLLATGVQVEKATGAEFGQEKLALET
jgi:aspartate ammonia-lyase